VCSISDEILNNLKKMLKIRCNKRLFSSLEIKIFIVQLQNEHFSENTVYVYAVYEIQM